MIIIKYIPISTGFLTEQKDDQINLNLKINKKKVKA